MDIKVLFTYSETQVSPENVSGRIDLSDMQKQHLECHRGPFSARSFSYYMHIYEVVHVDCIMTEIVRVSTSYFLLSFCTLVIDWKFFDIFFSSWAGQWVGGISETDLSRGFFFFFPTNHLLGFVFLRAGLDWFCSMPERVKSFLFISLDGWTDVRGPLKIGAHSHHRPWRRIPFSTLIKNSTQRKWTFLVTFMHLKLNDLHTYTNTEVSDFLQMTELTVGK